MKSIVIFFSLALLGLVACEMPCKIYTNQTVLGGLCPTPNYKIAPLLDYLNESRTDDVSLEIQKYYKEVSKNILDVLAVIPDMLKSSTCWSNGTFSLFDFFYPEKKLT